MTNAINSQFQEIINWAIDYQIDLSASTNNSPHHFAFLWTGGKTKLCRKQRINCDE